MFPFVLYIASKILVDLINFILVTSRTELKIVHVKYYKIMCFII